MRFLTCLMLFVLALSVYTFGQTRKIAHRSHSGSPSTFTAYFADDNFGMYYPPVKLADTVAKRVVRPVAPVDPANSLTPPVESDPSLPLDSEQPTAPEADTLFDPNAPESSQSSGKSDGQGRDGASRGPRSSSSAQGNGAESASAAAGSVAPQALPSTPAPAASNGGFMLLIGFLLFPVAPSVFLVSAVLGKKRGDAQA